MGWFVVIAYGWCLFLYLSVQFIELVYLNLNCVPVNESRRWRGGTLITKMCVITIHWMRTKEGKKKNQSRLCETQGDINSTRSKGDVGFRPVC